MNTPVSHTKLKLKKKGKDIQLTSFKHYIQKTIFPISASILFIKLNKLELLWFLPA